MPTVRPISWPADRGDLLDLGWRRCLAWCQLNGVGQPALNVVPRDRWVVSECVYYRPDTPVVRGYTTPGISICLELCSLPCGPAGRGWSWPCSITDRTPNGVLAHELGHHVDWLTGERKGRYHSEHCEQVMAAAGEPGLTSRADANPAEWYAEAFRLF